jgi:hypothetical protein
MRIRTKTALHESTQQKASRPKPRIGLRVAGLLLLLLICSAGFFVSGMVFYRAMQPRSPEAARVALHDMPRKLLRIAKNYAEAARRQETLERIRIDIKFKDLEQLRNKRAEAIRIGALVASDEDFVSAKIRHEGRSVRTKIRLKGDALDHLHGDKWSIRVHVKKDDQLFGMRRFSIQAPRVRDYQSEPIFLSHLRREGVLTPRYFFVDVTINGKDIGTMAVEEHFSKELLESQQRREGVILRFDESLFWMNRTLNGTFGPFRNPLVATLRPFRSSKIDKSPNLSADLSAAIGLMRGFLGGELRPRDVFDVELMARFMAVAEVWNAHHSLAWHNLRFYFNPLTARLEPVAFDGHLQGRSLGPGLIVQRGSFTPLLLEDPQFRDVFIRSLRRIAGEMADGSLVAWAREQERQLIPPLQEGFEEVAPLPTDFLMNRAENLARITADRFLHFLTPLGSPDMEYPEPVEVYLCSDCTPSHVEFINALPVPVEILSLALTSKSDGRKTVSDPIEGVELPLMLPLTKFLGAPTPVRVPFKDSLDPNQIKLEVVTRVSGQEQRHTVRAKPYSDVMLTSPIPAATLEEALSQHPFLNHDENSTNLHVDAGVWDVAGSLVVPENMGLLLSAGTELRFGEDGALIASGPLIFQGTLEKPVVLRPRPGLTSWAGIAAVRSDAPHVWDHVIVEATSGFMQRGWRLTGGVTLRRAEVKIFNTVFRGHKGEDALNLVRARFELENVEFYDTASDALDADFSDGIIRGGQFRRIGGDGIDVSGATIEVDGVEFSDISDKAISVGEGSRLTAHDVRIERVGTGAASKDRSELALKNSFISDAVVAAVTVYTKKPEYGPASATISAVEMRSVGNEVLVQAGSRATVDGDSVAEVPLDTKSLY